MASGDTLQGQQVVTVKEVWDGEPGTYCPVFEDGEVSALWFKLPTGSLGRIPNIGHGDGGPEWTITVVSDGTITVEPSIEQQAIPGNEANTPYWHGFLERGVWRET